MHNHIMRLAVAMAAAASLGTLGVTGASAATPAAHVSGPARAVAGVASDALARPGARIWVKRYNGPANDFDLARAMAAAGDRVFVTGQSTGVNSFFDYATAAYDAATGARLWLKRYGSSGDDTAYSVAAGGGRVFAAGDHGTVAYNAATGAQLWARPYEGIADSVAVSPGGDRVFVTGSMSGGPFGVDYGTVAYDAATGAQLWVQRYNGPGNGNDDAAQVIADPDGNRVFVTGRIEGATGDDDYATVAYSAATGTQLWVSRYNGPANSSDGATAAAISPSRNTVFVTGGSVGLTSGIDYATIAYNAATGTQLWVKRYNGPANHTDVASSVAVSAATVFVTGSSDGVTSNSDYATVAYNAATGARLWVERYNGPQNASDNAADVALSPCGRKVYVTGDSTANGNEDYATVAYSATGTRLWIHRYNGPANGTDIANSVAATPGRVFVTGGSDGTATGFDYATIAYRG